MHCTDERPIVIASPEHFGVSIGIEANGRRLVCKGDEKPSCEEGSGVKYAFFSVSTENSKSRSVMLV